MQFSKYATLHKKPLQTHENIGPQTCQFLQKCIPEGKRPRDIVEVVKAKLILNVYSCFLRRNSVIFVRLVINNLLYLLVLQENLSDQFFCSGKRHKFARNRKKNIRTNTTFSVLKFVSLRIRWTLTLFKKITKKATKNGKNTLFAFIFQDYKTQNFNRDYGKTLFHHCLLHLIHLRGLGCENECKNSILWKQRGRVVRSSNLKSRSRGFKSRSDH